MGLEPGQVLDGKYRIAKLIGEGGMGAVFEGINTFINRKVAIKVLHAASAGNEQVLRRFEREAQAAGTIGSDHILEVIDLGSLPGGDRYMVMEFLEGEELSTRIERKGRLSPEELCPILRQTLVGLKAAHAAQIIHRDLKPENIFVLREKAGQKDFVKIIDFGISKFNALGGDMSMTTTGAVMGTPYYMSPEQAKGMAQVDARTDLYAVGVIMYQALTGSVPFDGTSFNELMFKIVLAEPPELDDSVPEAFRAMVMKAMARDTRDRYQTADEFIFALDQYMADGTVDGSVAFERELSRTVPGGRLNKTTSTRDGSVSGAQTDGNFAHTRGELAAKEPPKRKSPLPLALGAAAVVLVAGLAFALRGGSAEEVEVSAAVIPVHDEAKPGVDDTEVQAPPTPPKADLEQAEKDLPPAPLEEEEKPPEPAKQQATRPSPKPQSTKAPAPKAPATATATAAPQPKPAAAAQPKPAAAPRPKPASDGRDFGY